MIAWALLLAIATVFCFLVCVESLEGTIPGRVSPAARQFFWAFVALAVLTTVVIDAVDGQMFEPLPLTKGNGLTNRR